MAYVQRQKREPELYCLTMHLHEERERAVMVSKDGVRDYAVWLPLSQIEVTPARMSGNPNVRIVSIPHWLAHEKGLA